VLLPHAVFFGIQGLWIGRWLSDVAAFRRRRGLPAVPGHGGRDLRRHRGRHDHRVGGPARHDAARRGGGRRGLFVLVQAAFVSATGPAWQLLSVLFTLVGTITGIEYAIVAQSMPRALTGRAATCLNLLIFIGAFLVQAGFGQVVGLWRRMAAATIRPWPTGRVRRAGAAAAARAGPLLPQAASGTMPDCFAHPEGRL
jgi:hypothetical protein